jgi:NodT family efflux transporter outer membrane factor (OMF) lipoprotein
MTMNVTRQQQDRQCGSKWRPRITGFETIGLALGVMLLISGCTSVGPDYEMPEATVEAQWQDANSALITDSMPADSQWWTTAFQDAELDHLIDVTLQQNLSLQSAGLRVLQSQQQLAIVVGNQYPQQQRGSGSAGRERTNGSSFNTYNLGFNLGWEADFWGRFRRQVESASAQLDASVVNYDAAMLSLVSQVAQNYILIRTYQNRLDVAKLNLELQVESQRIALAKLNAGATSELDSDQADSLLNNTKATLSSLEASLQQSKNAMAGLLGQAPQSCNYLLLEPNQIPSVPQEIALGMPQDLVRRRPDIRAAERQLASQSAQIGYALTDLYPHLSIGGSVGTSALHTRDIFNKGSDTWSLFGLFEWNLFNYGRLKSNVRLQDALFQQLLVDYHDTVLQAQVDVENAIVVYLKSHEELASYRLAAEASQRAVDVSAFQYQNGLVGFNTVINTLESNVRQQDLLASTEGSVAANLVQVYKSLGGGWEIREDQDPVELLPAAIKDEMEERTKLWKGTFQ